MLCLFEGGGIRIKIGGSLFTNGIEALGDVGRGITMGLGIGCNNVIIKNLETKKGKKRKKEKKEERKEEKEGK